VRGIFRSRLGSNPHTESDKQATSRSLLYYVFSRSKSEFILSSDFRSGFPGSYVRPCYGTCSQAVRVPGSYTETSLRSAATPTPNDNSRAFAHRTDTEHRCCIKYWNSAFSESDLSRQGLSTTQTPVTVVTTGERPHINPNLDQIGCQSDFEVIRKAGRSEAEALYRVHKRKRPPV
jgi:hypothetical protein